MALTSTLARVPCSRAAVAAGSAVASRAASIRQFSDEKGRIFSEEEKAKEKVYIQKMERERLEKARKKLEKEEQEVEKSKHSDKKPEESHKN